MVIPDKVQNYLNQFTKAQLANHLVYAESVSHHSRYHEQTFQWIFTEVENRDSRVTDVLNEYVGQFEDCEPVSRASMARIAANVLKADQSEGSK